MRQFWKVALMGVAICFLTGTSIVFARATPETQQIFMPIEEYWPGGILEDEHGCFGESIQLSGDLHIVIHSTEDANGVMHYMYSDNPQGIHGVGLSSGASYQLQGGEKYSFRTKTLPESFNYVSNFRVLGAGKAGTLLFHMNGHLTINAQGDVSVSFEKFAQNDECR